MLCDIKLSLINSKSIVGWRSNEILRNCQTRNWQILHAKIMLSMEKKYYKF